jgi:glycosyltransferase involved in cell wall biosynthesis
LKEAIFNPQKESVKPTKILFLYPNQFLGPEMTVYTQIVRHLDRSRFRAYLALDADAQGDIHLSEAKDGVVISRWKFGTALRGGLLPGILSALRLPATIIKVARYARREGISVVQASSTPRTATLGLIMARLAGARLLLHYHVIPGRYGGLRGLAERAIARRADRSVAVSRFLADKVRALGLSGRDVDVVVNGTDCRRFNPQVDGSAMRREYGIAPGEVLVFQLARIIQQKRQEETVRAFAIAHRDAPQLRCLIVGWEDPRYEGPFPGYKAELEHISREQGLGNSLIIADARPEAAELVAAADIVVMPSLEDAWNLAVTEAMAGGKPVVGSLSGGIPEQIVDGETGYLVPLYSPEAIAEKLVALANDPDLRARMGHAARQRAESLFDEKHLATKFAPIYEVLGRNQKSEVRSQKSDTRKLKAES